MPKGRKLVPVNGFTCSRQSRHCQNAQLPCGFCFGAKEGTWMQLPTYWAFHSSPRCCQRTSLIPMPQGEGQQGGTWWDLKLVGSCSASMILMQWKSECIIPVTPTTWATMQCKRIAAECAVCDMASRHDIHWRFLGNTHNQKSQCRDTWEGQGTQHQFEFKVFMDSHLWSLREYPFSTEKVWRISTWG